MAKKAALFRLIQSMSRSEKRYFRLFVQKEGANYLRLFAAIEKQKEYDEAAIRKQFKNESFAKQLHVAKNYLAELIMRALRNYHARSSVNAQVLGLLHEAEILFIRELYDHCGYALAKAEQLARDHEQHALGLEVLDAKRRLALVKSAGHGTLLATTLAAESGLIDKVSHLNKTWQLTTKLFENVAKKDFLEADLIARNSSHATIRSESLRRHVRYSWYFMNGQRKKGEKEVDALLAMLESHPHYISEDPSPYITALGNKISMLLGTERITETEALLLQMRKAPQVYKLKRNSRFTLRLWLRLFNLELEFYRDNRKADRALALTEEINRFLSEHASAVPVTYVLLFRFQFALVQYDAGDLRACLKEINAIINGDFGNERPDILCGVRLLNLVVHFELGNILVLRYIVDSTQRFLTKHKGLNAPEMVLLNLFKKLSRAEKSEYRSLFRTSALVYKSGEDSGHFDFGRWMAAKC
jgi:hypothetical protein